MAYTLVRFWRYVFVPLVLLALSSFGIIVFTVSGNQTEIGELMKPVLKNSAANAVKGTMALLPNTK